MAVVNWRYREYLTSPEWKAKRQERLELDGRECSNCDATTRLEVHHRTYERFGNERMEDLITLCHTCHRRQHGRAPTVLRPAGPSGEELARRGARSRTEAFWGDLVVAAVRLDEALEDFRCEMRGWGRNGTQNDRQLEIAERAIRGILDDCAKAAGKGLERAA